jgi:hypothetical protein
MSLPRPIRAVLAPFEPLFTAPTWKKVMTLLIGTRFSRGRRTVRAALRQMGLQMNGQFSLCASRAQSSALVTACSEQKTLASACWHLCACRRDGRNRD